MFVEEAPGPDEALLIVDRRGQSEPSRPDLLSLGARGHLLHGTLDHPAPDLLAATAQRHDLCSSNLPDRSIAADGPIEGDAQTIGELVAEHRSIEGVGSRAMGEEGTTIDGAEAT